MTPTTPARRFSAASWSGQLGSLVAAGLVSGVLAKVGDVAGGWAGILNTFPAIWIVIIAVIAFLVDDLRTTPVAEVVYFLAMIAGYYGYSVIALGFGWPQAIVAMWTVAALTICPLLGTALLWARRHPGPLGGLIVATTVAVSIATGYALNLRYLIDVVTGLVSPMFGFGVQFLVELATVVFLIASFGWGRSRWWTLGFLLPTLLVARPIGDVLWSSLYTLF